MQIIKDTSESQLKKLRFAFHLMAEKGVTYQAAIDQVNQQWPTRKNELTNVEQLHVYKSLSQSAIATTINLESLKYDHLKALVDNQMLTSAYWHAIKNVISYSLSVIVCSLVVFYIIGAKVLPNFKSIYLDSGYQAPGVTQWVVEWGHYYWLIAIIVVVITVLVIVLSKSFANSLAKMAPLGRLVTLLVPRKLSIQYHDYLVILFIDALINSGASSDDAIKEVSRCVLGDKVDRSVFGQGMSSLYFAKQLNVFTRELKYQLQQAPEILVSSLYDFKKLMSRTVFVISAIFIGISLMAVYLPIFHFGQAF